jgi:hypothetical protein
MLLSLSTTEISRGSRLLPLHTAHIEQAPWQQLQSAVALAALGGHVPMLLLLLPWGISVAAAAVRQVLLLLLTQLAGPCCGVAGLSACYATASL